MFIVLSYLAIEITSSSQTLTVGDTATITCTSLLGQADTIEWLLVDGPEMLQETNSGQAALELVLDPVSESMNGSVYRCRVIIGGATVDQDVTVTIQGELLFSCFSGHSFTCSSYRPPISHQLLIAPLLILYCYYHAHLIKKVRPWLKDIYRVVLKLLGEPNLSVGIVCHAESI